MASAAFQPYLELFLPVIRGMCALVEHSEFILHDLSDPEHSLVAIEGNVTGRSAGASVTNIVIEAVARHGDAAPDMIGYSSVAKDGRPLKSSTVFIRNAEGHIVGCMCSNIDMTDYLVARNLLERICTRGSTSAQQGEEIFEQDIRKVVEEIIKTKLEAAAKPVPTMTRGEKVQLVRELESKCVFEVKGAVEYAAQCMGVSSFTIYGYLKEIRSEKTA